MKLAVVLIRGLVHMRSDIKAALNVMKLRKKHTCVVLDDTPGNRGLLQKVKDYVAYGPIPDELATKLKGVVHLHPPRGGFERKGIKISYQQGGALGLRTETMPDLLKRMM